MIFINGASFRELLRTSSGEWSKNNNGIKTKFTPTVLNVIKKRVSRNEIKKYGLEKTEVGDYGSTVNYSSSNI